MTIGVGYLIPRRRSPGSYLVSGQQAPFFHMHGINSIFFANYLLPEASSVEAVIPSVQKLSGVRPGQNLAGTPQGKKEVL